MKELIEKYVGKKATINFGNLEINVTIVDVKVTYGKERYLVEPVSGKGKTWVEAVYIPVTQK